MLVPTCSHACRALAEARAVVISAPQIGPAWGGVGVAGGGELAGFARLKTAHRRHRCATC